MSIFKAYDIRGKYPETLDEDTAYKIGRAFVFFTKTKDVMVGRDSRVHSLSLINALIRGITDQGANVTDIGLATTPQTIAMHIWKKHETAIIVSASHLDAEFNGFKMYTQGGKNITINYGMKEMEQLVEQNSFTSNHKGTVVQKDYTQEYSEHISALCPATKDILFVADCSNGAVYPELAYHEKNMNLIVINSDPDGTFPNHSPNPIQPGADKQIREIIQKKKAAGGCIFDADADRIVFFDEKGQMIHPNYISALIIEELLKRHPKSVIAYDVISSRIVPETIVKNGGTPLRTRVGRNVLVDDMRPVHALFAGESSSHMIYREANYADATTLSMLLVTNILAKARLPFSELMKPFATYALLHETNYEVPDADAAIKAIEAEFPSAPKDYLDGVYITLPYGWVNLRKSQTEPLLRLRAEANSQEDLKKLFKQAESVIKSHKGVLSKH